MSKNALVIKNINHSYSSKQSIVNFNLTVQAGEIVCLLGPSGAGKTTLLNIVAGFEKPDSGEILVGGKIISGLDNIPVEKREIGMLFQDIALFPHLTVEENIGFSLNKYKKNIREKKVNELLKNIKLTHLKYKYPHLISGGEQQRVALLRALAAEPKVMLLDEPFSSLDVWTKFEIADDVISYLKKSDTPTLMVTHDPQEAMKLSDRIVIIIDGKVIDEGSSEKLYSNPSTAFSADISGPATIITPDNHKGRLMTPFGILDNFKNISNKNKYLIYIRPDAFTVTLDDNLGITIKLKNIKNLGGFSQLTVQFEDGVEIENVVFPSSIINEIQNGGKLLFNKEWAFVFPISK